MEKSDNQNNQNILSLDNQFTNMQDEIISIIEKKFSLYEIELDKISDEINLKFDSSLYELNSLNLETNTLKSEFDSQYNPEKYNEYDKNEILAKTNELKTKIGYIMYKTELFETLKQKLANSKLCEMIRIENDELKCNFEEVYVNEPAGESMPDICKLCRSSLTWKERNLREKCKRTSDCNNQYRYGCVPCNTSFCTRCAFPRHLPTCGCGMEMEYKGLHHNSCDLCRSSLNGGVMAYRCQSCDFDCCVDCFDRTNEIWKKFGMR